MRQVVLTVSLLFLSGCSVHTASPEELLRFNQLQFVGSHNSYKQAMSPEHVRALRQTNPAAADALDYSHLPIPEQLDLGLRKLELDVFAIPQSDEFVVGHVQVIDMNSHCASLRECLRQIRAWSDINPRHVPLWISFNAKDQPIEGLPDPTPFSADELIELDAVLQAELGNKLLRPSDVVQSEGLPQWPLLEESRGKMLLILDERGVKRDEYLANWRVRPMFLNVPAEHPAAAIMILNDPVGQVAQIQNLVRRGFMLRTRADADTLEARAGTIRRRDAAFASGAQAVSTDYYAQVSHFPSQYRVMPVLLCNPLLTQKGCLITE